MSNNYESLMHEAQQRQDKEHEMGIGALPDTGMRDQFCDSLVLLEHAIRMGSWDYVAEALLSLRELQCHLIVFLPCGRKA